MATSLVIMQDGETILRFERGVTLPALQRRQLDELDFRLDQGIELDGERIAAPNRQQRIEFVIGLLVRALQRDDATALRGLSTYLSHRAPELTLIRVQSRGATVEVALEYGPGNGSDV
jgi:hypothetical protein